tara:strand:+ start:1960 stop:2130 length:171 start_codon:yes stop_codon:yes gene_type:complete
MPDYDKKYGLAKATSTELTPNAKASNSKELASAKATTSDKSNSSNMGYKKRKNMGY